MDWAVRITSRPGGGQICPTIIKFQNYVENHFFKVCHYLHYIKIIIVKVGLAKEKFLNKKLRRKNLRGGADLPPPGQLGLIFQKIHQKQKKVATVVKFFNVE